MTTSPVMGITEELLAELEAEANASLRENGTGFVERVTGFSVIDLVAEVRRLRAALAQQPASGAVPVERPTDAMLDEMRRRGLTIDGDNAYKRDLIDCIVGALMLGKQGVNPPPPGHWAEQFWQMARAEGEIQEQIADAQSTPAPAAQELVAQCPFCGESSGHCDQGFPHPGKTAKTPPAAEQPDTVKVPRELLVDAESIIESYAEAIKASHAPGGDWDGEEAAHDEYELEVGVASKLRALLRR